MVDPKTMIDINECVKIRIVDYNNMNISLSEKDSQIASLKEQLKNSIIFIREQRETTDNRIASLTRQLETKKRHWVEDVRNFDAFNKEIASLKELVREAMLYVIRYDGDGYWLNRAKDIK